jgi:hypothetical protein
MSGRVVPRAELSADQRRAMFTLFARYYDEIARDRFDEDLDGKDYVILLFDEDGAIQGFSTIRHLTVEHGGRVHRGLFSGDTVVAEEFWGQRVLGQLFLRHLFAQKLRHPFAPYWWMLISKGYKTYLLMANNFAEHWPRHEVPTPADKQEVLDAFAGTLFPEAYAKETGLIAFTESLGQLKSGVAGITTELLSHPRIAFFAERNPSWKRGTELACIARMTWTMPMYYAAKALWKQWARLGRELAGAPSAAGD